MGKMYYGWTVVGVTLIWIFASKSFARTCIRNEEKVANGRKCNPLCKNNTDCVNPGEKCICDDVCGRSCFNPDLLCRKLESPRYGYILGKERHYDDSVLYYCHSGYVLNGPNHRRCRSDGKWTGITPKCLPVSTCGLSETPGERLALKKVVRGSQTSTSRWPWHVTLIQNLKNKIDDSFKSLHGSGIIINDHWVLTAAHLFALFSTNKPALVDHSIFVVAGLSELPKPGSMLHDGVQVYRPGVIIRHSRFNRINNDNDICLIRVGARVIPGKKGRFEISPSLPSFRFTFDEHVRPVCLPCVNEWIVSSLNISVESKYSRDKCETRQDKIVGRPAVVTGFGGMAPINQNALFPVKWSNVLRKGDLRILPDNVCIKGVKKINMEYKNPEFTSNMICAKGVHADNLQDACRGDSGGPLVTKVLSKEGREYWVLTGIVSWGWGCANKDKEGFIFPGYYSNVIKYVTWIFENTEKNDTRENTQNSIVTAYLAIYAFSATRIQRTYWILVVDINSTIDSIKQDIENKFPNYKKYQQQLYFDSKRMFSDRTLKSYGIRNPKPIILVRVFLN